MILIRNYHWIISLWNVTIQSSIITLLKRDFYLVTLANLQSQLQKIMACKILAKRLFSTRPIAMGVQGGQHLSWNIREVREKKTKEIWIYIWVSLFPPFPQCYRGWCQGGTMAASTSAIDSLARLGLMVPWRREKYIFLLTFCTLCVLPWITLPDTTTWVHHQLYPR